MPDKHEVGGSSPLGPTNEVKSKQKARLYKKATSCFRRASTSNKRDTEARLKRRGVDFEADKVPARHKPCSVICFNFKETLNSKAVRVSVNVH